MIIDIKITKWLFLLLYTYYLECSPCIGPLGIMQMLKGFTARTWAIRNFPLAYPLLIDRNLFI